MVLVMLAAACVLVLALALDIRKRQKAHAAAIVALQARTAGHGLHIETLGRAVAALVPPDARPTAPHAAAAVDQGRARLPPPPPVPRGLSSSSADEGPPSPHRSVAAVERQIAEMAGAPAEPVETEGDRAGVNPGDAPDLGRLPGETHEAWGDRLDLLHLARQRADAEEIRERFQRAADAQDARDAAAPPGDDDRTIETVARPSAEPDDERTRIRQGASGGGRGRNLGSTLVRGAA